MLFRQNLPNLQSKIRFLHAIPSAPAVDVYLNGQLYGENLKFSDISCYEGIESGEFEFQMYVSGTYDKPLISKKINILPNTNFTVSIVTLSGNIDIFVLNDASVKGDLLSCFLRFIHLAPNSPLITLGLPNDVTLFGNVEYLETTGYYQLSPAIYNFKVTFASASGLFKYISDKKLENGKFYTIYLIGLIGNKPPIGYLLVEDGKNS